MNMSYIDQGAYFNKTFGSLPPAIQQAIGTVDFADEIYKIGGDFDLLVSEIGDIIEVTAKLITGETKAVEFVGNVRNKLDDENKTKAGAIARAINEKVLLPIRDAFKKISLGQIPAPSPAPGIITNPPPEVAVSQTEAVIAPGQPSEPAPQELSPAETAELIGIALEPAPQATTYPVFANMSAETMGGTAGATPLIRTSLPEAQKPATPPAPAPQEIKPATPLQSAVENAETHNIDSAAPQPAGTGAPINLPTDANGPKDIPIWRTMQRDVASTGMSETAPEEKTGRGKFGTGPAPAIKAKPNILQPSNPVLSYNKDAAKNIPSAPPASPGPAPRPIAPPPAPAAPSSQPGIPPRPATPPQAPNTPASSGGAPVTKPNNYAGEDIIGDKLTKIVRMPSERKQYVVDPYREPLE